MLDFASLAPQDLDLTQLERCFSHWQAFDDTPAEQIAERLVGTEVILTNKVPIKREHLAQAKALKLLCVSATGTNHIDLAAAAEFGITVCNAPEYSTPAVVQHTFALLLALVTRLVDYNRQVRQGDWQRAKQFCLLNHPIDELMGKTLGIVGYGHLGQGVAQVAKAFGMQVLVAQRPGTRYYQQNGVERLPLTDLLPQVDVLSIHCQLSPQTLNLIDQSLLALLKPGALVINTARGGIVNEQAVADALRAGKLGGAAFDVLSQEPPTADNPLLQPGLPNLIITPHTAWASRQSRQRLVDALVTNITQFQQGNPVNRVA
jgi:glycerate dehydrogenase